MLVDIKLKGNNAVLIVENDNHKSSPVTVKIHPYYYWIKSTCD